MAGYDISMWDYLTQLRGGAPPAHAPVFSTANGQCAAIELAIRYDKERDCKIVSFANGKPTGKGGSHEKAVREGILQAANAYRKEFAQSGRPCPKKEEETAPEIKWNNLCRGLTIAINVDSSDVYLEGMAKDKAYFRSDIYELCKAMAYEAYIGLLRENTEIKDKIFRKNIDK